ncbi:MAG TPA: DUF4136 domain-containing protein [Burkholderiaceae bacterium]
MQSAARILASLALAGLLAACASLTTMQAEVASYGNWPAQRKPGTYAFERLPSQQARADAQQRLEDAARPAVEGAGFTAAAPGETPDVLVQVGARITRYETSPWYDPWWYGGYYGYGYGYWRGRPWPGVYRPYPFYPYYPYWHYAEPARYDREVGLLLRDRGNGTPLYEARASSNGYSSGGDELLSALFRASMADFPNSGSVPHSVTLQLSP